VTVQNAEIVHSTTVRPYDRYMPVSL